MFDCEVFANTSKEALKKIHSACMFPIENGSVMEVTLRFFTENYKCPNCESSYEEQEEVLDGSNL